MNYFQLFMDVYSSITEGLGFIKKNIKTVDTHHIMEVEGQLWTLEGYVKRINEENKDLKVENNTLRKMIKDQQESNK